MIEFSAGDLASGSMVGYEDSTSFYFRIPEERGGKSLRNLRTILEPAVSHFIQQPFEPHVTIGATDRESSPVPRIRGLASIHFRVKEIRLMGKKRQADGTFRYELVERFPLRGDQCKPH
jgi:2'-5' RNA ligase